MARGMPEYVKYTINELDKYTNTDGACVQKINTNLHLNMLPVGLKNLKKSLQNSLSTKKIGSYDQNLKGIILDIHNIKLLGNSGAIRFDDPYVHVDINSDCYIFKPTVGAIVRGTVRHVSSSQIGVIIYRVFSVSIRLLNKHRMPIEIDTEIDLRVKKYSLDKIYPYIEGELMENGTVEGNTLKRPKVEKCDDEDSENIDSLIAEIKTEEAKELENSPAKRRKKIKIQIPE